MNTPLDPSRFDPLLLVHKAVRHVLFDVATQVGSVDASDIFAVDRCASQVGRLVELLPASGAALAPLIDDLYQRDAARRHAAAAALYREVTALLSAELARQQREEAADELRPRFGHDELRAMRRERLAAMSEGELAEAMGPLGAALTPQELAAFLDDLQASVDPQSFASLTDALQRRLDAPRWARIVRERGDAQAAPVARVGRRSAGSRQVRSLEPVLQRRPHRADRHRVISQ